MRLLAAIVVQPHTKKKVDVKKLIKFSWEHKRPEAEKVSREEAKRRFEKLTANMTK